MERQAAIGELLHGHFGLTDPLEKGGRAGFRFRPALAFTRKDDPPNFDLRLLFDQPPNRSSGPDFDIVSVRSQQQETERRTPGSDAQGQHGYRRSARTGSRTTSPR